MPFVEDLDAFMADFGVPITFDGAPPALLGIQDFADVGQVGNSGHAEVIGRHRTLLIRSDAATLLRPNSVITVNGISRIVLDPRAQEDGAFNTLTLR
jgi:hypothetical protein